MAKELTMPPQFKLRSSLILQINNRESIMFRLESYITPLVMNYIDRYVKLKPQDFQMSLWGGAAVLNQLDLRLDAIESALNLPIKLTNGHISELKIQVPWTKLGFEPVVVTINTMECVLSLRNADSISEAGSSTDGNVANPKPSKSKKSSKQDPDVPPGYIQSLLNRIMNNVNVVVENLILKFVEEDIVFSMNIKTVEIFSVNNEWKRAFAELSAPDFILRRLMEFTDLTVCLDKVNRSDGKIEVYQDPLIYRCSLSTRVQTKYDHIHSSMPSTTKIHTMCDELNLSLTDTQLPLFARLIELMLAIYYGDISLSPSESTQHTSETPAQAEVPEPVQSEEEVNSEGGWASWAWSMVPQVLPEQNEDSGSTSSGESETTSRPSPPVFDISFFNRKATLVVKLSRYMHSKSVKASAAKVLFEPLAELRLEGNALEIIAKGLIFLDVQIGFTAASINGTGDCICAMALPKSSQGTPILEAGDRQPKQGQHYLTGCLFDKSSHHSSISTYVFDYDKHCEKYKESWAVERFGALWINYLWIEEPPRWSSTGISGELKNGSEFKPDFIDESTHMKFWFHQVTLNYNSDMKHRMDKFLYCLSDHTYEPYAKHSPELVDPSRPVPSTEQVEALEKFIPVKDVHLAFLRCRINVYPANHPDVDISVAKSSRGRRSQPVVPACWLRLYSERVDMQTTAPMYPRRLIKLISALPAPSGNLIYHCRYHRNIKLMGLTAEVRRQHASPDSFSIIRPLSAAYYHNILALPVYWTKHDVEISSTLYELPEVTLHLSFPLLKTALSVWNSWSSHEYRENLHSTSLVADAFSVSGEFPVVDVSFSRFEMKQSSGNSFHSAFGNVGSIYVSVITKGGDDQVVSTVLQAPADTAVISQGHVFTTTQAIAECSDDFLCFTYQLPSMHGEQPGGETTAVLCTMQGWTATADPILLDLLLYREQPMSLPDLQRRLETTSLPSPPVGSSLPRHLSEVTLKSETSSATPSFNEQKHPEHSVHAKSEPASKSETKKSNKTWLDYLPTLHCLSQNIAVNVKVSSGCVLMPAVTLTNLSDSGEYDMAKQWRQLAYSGSLPRSLVICLPSITATSYNVSVFAPVEDFPIRVESSRAASLPVVVGIDSFSVYTYVDRTCKNLLEPVSCTSTITLQAHYKQHEPDQQKCLLSLALSAQHSVGHVVANISNAQVELMCELMSVWFKLLPMMIRLRGGAGTTPNEGDVAGEVFSTHSNSQPSMHSMHDTVSYTEPADSELSHSSGGNLSTGTQPNVKLSFRTEAKLSHICLNLFLKQQGYRFECVRGVGEEVSAYLDVYKDYFKVQSKIWSIELLHGYFDQRCEEFVTGSRHGILLSSCRRFINLQQVDAGKDMRHLSQLMKEQPREGILTITYTSASHQSLKQRDVDYASRLSGKREGYITELCIDMAKCDVIFHLPVIVSTMQMLLVDSLSALKPLLQLLPAKITSESTKRQAQSPWFHSQTLPLIHLTAGETRFFFPVDGLSTGKHDVIVFSIHGVELTPQAENPLSRLVLDNDLFKRNVSRMNTPGSIVEDRQLQMDLIGLSLLAGTWSEMVLEDKGLCPSSFENPAFEWNKIAKATDVEVARLYPVMSKVNLKVQLAPAIAVDKKVMCGHSIEVNVRSEIDISITDLHISLGHVLFQQLNSAVTNTMAILRETTGDGTESPSHKASRGKKHASKSIPMAQYVSMVYPVNVLMTACDIAVTLIGKAGKQAIASFHFSQPHTILCTKPKSERLELSCYDVKMLVGQSVHEPSAPDILVGREVRLEQALLQTSQGVPDSKTGIYPAAFTLKVTKYLSKPEISVVIGRPVHVVLPVHSLHGLSTALQQMLPSDDKPASHPDKTQPNIADVEDESGSSHLGCKALDVHTVFPLECIGVQTCQLAGEIRLSDETTIHMGAASTCTQLTLSATTDSGQLDAGLSLACEDVELALSSRQFKAKVVGPVSFTVKPDVTLSATHPFTSTCAISSSVLPLQLGNESLQLAGKIIQELSSLSPAGAGKKERSEVSPSVPMSPVSRKDYQDDLRQGTFKYRLDEEQRIPRANTVLFYSDRDYSTLAWTYTEPRVLTNVHINPIPFDYPTDQNATFHCFDIQIQCSLEWWNNSEQQYVCYGTFAISEQFGTSVALPFIGSKSCIPAVTWRIIINYYIDRSYTADYSFEHVFAMVSPAVLVAAMRVDSVYMPELIPALQMSMAIDQIRVGMFNQYSVSNTRGYHDKLSPFVLDDCDVLDHELFNILINNARLEGSLWNADGQETSVKADLVFDIMARHLDYRHLVWQNCMQMVGSNVEAVVKHSPANQSQVTLKSDVKELEFIVSQSLFNAVLHLHHVWGETQGPRPLSGLYAICNNTHSNIFIKQTKCEDDSIVCIASGQAHSFCWGHYNDLRLELAVEELANQWSTPVELDLIGQQVAKITAAQTLPLHLIVDIEKVTSIHRMVTVSGSVHVSSRLSTTELDVRLSTGSTHRHVKVSPGHTFSSFAVSTEGELELRVKPTSTDNSSYSNSLSVTREAAKSALSAPQLLKIGGEDLNEMHAFYRVHTRDVCQISQYLVEITPIYSVRSYIPHSLMLNVLPSTHTRLEGNSTTTELTSVSGTRPHQMSLQLSDSDVHGTVMLPLTTDKLTTLTDLEQYSPHFTILQICRQSLGGDKSTHTGWPCSSQSLTLSGKSQPLSLQRGESVAADSLTIHYTQSDSVGLDIDWTQRWPGAPSLLMTIKPRCVFVNQSAADLTLVYSNQFCVLHSGETVLQPSKLNGSFYIGAYNSKRLFLSELIRVSNEEVTPRSFFIQNETILFMDSYVYGSVVILNADESIHKLMYLVITSHTDSGVRVITLHDRFIIDNCLTDSLYMSMLIAPISSDRVPLECVHKNPRLIEGKKAISLDYHTLSSNHVLSSSAAALFFTFSFASKGEWSYPVQIPIESINRRLGVAIPLPSGCRSCSLLTHIVNGVTYITLADTRVPSLLIQNCCSFPLAFGQTLTRDSEDVLESMSLLAQPPSVLPGSTTLYTFPTVNKQFPAYVEGRDYPKLKLAGMNGHYGVEVWCEGIDISDISSPKFINIPDVGGAKVTFSRHQLNTHLHVEPVDRAKVMAKEVKVGSGDVYYLTATGEPEESPSELSPPVVEREQSIRKGELNLSVKVLVEKVSMLLLDEELSTSEQSPEVLRLMMEGAGVELSRKASPSSDGTMADTMDVSVYVLNTCIYNQLWHSKHFDFPVVVMAQHPLHLATLTSTSLTSIEEQSLLSLKLRLSNNQLMSVCVSSKPVVLNIEDIFLQSVLALADSYLTSVSILPACSAPQTERIVPRPVRKSSQKSEISLLELSIDKLNLLISFHASVKVFVASDQAPISLGPFHRLHIVSTYEQLITDLAFHYGTGALYSAGWVVGSLELLFNPTGMIRSFMAGMSDLVYLPYHGLQRGPGAFVTGVSQGLTSAVKNVTRGTLTSVSLFAQSVSRNMDRLSLDGSHYERQERMRHQKPQALSQGLSQGFKGLAFSFLGAVAGLADEPLQGLWSENASASGLVKGVGKGLLGAVTKPISGTAELISQTGQGLMNSVGLSAGDGQPLSQIYDPLNHKHEYTTLKYRWRYPLLRMHHRETLHAIRGSTLSCGEEELTMLLLQPQLIIVMDCKENVQQQAFAISEIDCLKYEQSEEKVYLQLILTGQEQSPRVTDSGLLTKHRIEDYVDSTTSGYQSGVGETNATSTSNYYSCTDSLLLHEYCVPAMDVDFFIAMFRYAKDALEKE